MVSALAKLQSGGLLEISEQLNYKLADSSAAVVFSLVSCVFNLRYTSKKDVKCKTL